LSQLQDLILLNLQKHGFFDVLVLPLHYINQQNQDWALLLLDIIYMVFKRDDPSDILSPGVRLGEEEREKKTSGRHPTFGGVFVLTSADGEKTIANASRHLSEGGTKLPPVKRAPVKYGRNRPPPPGRKSPAHLRPLLKKFADKILSTGFNGKPPLPHHPFHCFLFLLLYSFLLSLFLRTYSFQSYSPKYIPSSKPELNPSLSRTTTIFIGLFISFLATTTSSN
jgi:hypothetical protein